jgi:prepilin-type N-terminal cleavage/methylation domain-containing protein
MKLITTKRRGLTLVELLVSIVILTVVLTAIYSIMIAQQNRSIQVSRTSVMQTDAQVAMTMLKWDLMLSGLGYPYTDPNVVSNSDGGGGGSDQITIRSVGLGFESGQMHWNYILTFSPSGSTSIDVRRWNDVKYDIATNDAIIVLNQERTPEYTNLIVQNVVPFNYTMPNGAIVPANHLIFSAPFPEDLNFGLCIFTYNSGQYNPGIRYYLNNNHLMRQVGNNLPEALLDNVEDFQLAYDIDQNQDGQLDGTWINGPIPPNPMFSRLWAIRYTMVVASQGMPGYKWTAGNITVENHTYDPLAQPNGIRRKRTFMSTVVFPHNLEP